MTLKAVLFDFNGVIINDEPLHEKLLEQILLEENLRSKPGEFRELCLGRSDRACLTALLERRGRVVTDEYLTKLIERKSQAYQQTLATIEALPIYSGVIDLMLKLRSLQLPIGVVSGAVRSEIEFVLQRIDALQHVTVIVSGDEIKTSKPDPEGYLLAIDRLNQLDPDRSIQPQDCLAIEDTPAGITAAKQAGISVVGVANSYPFHVMQRLANWAVDYVVDLELDRIQDVLRDND